MATDNQWTVFFAEDDEDDFIFFEMAVSQTHPDCLVERFESFESLIDGVTFHGSLQHIIIFINLPTLAGPGFGILDQIRRSPAFDHVPVFILSANVNPEIISNAYNQQASSYLFKPASFNEWKELLRPAVSFAKNL
ncbi:response regulator RpfG family c-di-GMP phosphodiesterase [Dyadobacter sp. BE34]|uniref:Response regulator RpfG family c-di-GMP phosphodiesterase n=1 Tax=Dyadobacter fermentans TaxID=94254 RepID=A0ABU1R863_9BACT|nr:MULTISPECIES: response regulator [Dyadobacter]MDR6809594.1 response regulator RpfG family c-di-GMP phosphodiesterase [Dyadobacter fermentans]MDR7047272.1 response regulator RpfG family c-di-GMP phosphodiesterase [Dyadobacter sp. BE242]MDR7201508.1 response regulator RpfG family c-di-GMP phosphodiesterase [Dyadobacter sp. BE34]MDR7219378.1 response regulator RpfG family c-di-GMP phosphodiesterase [Dyadobacter sp. BE31]MDR7267228.1 response regulator RpfG family c-di-GMP phosphodiesterase [Dy